MLAALAFLQLAVLAAHLALLLEPARRWSFRPAGDDGSPPESEPEESWPAVLVVVPARNEAASLPKSLPSLLGQRYPGAIEVVVVENASSDATAEVAAEIARQPWPEGRRLEVARSGPAPAGWSGKVWAMDTGLKRAWGGGSKAGFGFLLFTDADIVHEPDALRRLVAESREGGLGLNSRMARLACRSPAERLLIPAFVFFFNLLYPMAKVNDPRSPAAAAAGGCLLISREAVARLDGRLEPMRSELIDDVALARLVKAGGLPIRLALSRRETRSIRQYPKISDIANMIARTAFCQLGYRVSLLAAALAAIGLAFALPPLALAGLGAASALEGGQPPHLVAAVASVAILWIQSRLYSPAVRFFELPSRYRWTLPAAGCLYGAMTLLSALRHWRKRPVAWRDAGP